MRKICCRILKIKTGRMRNETIRLRHWSYCTPSKKDETSTEIHGNQRSIQDSYSKLNCSSISSSSYLPLRITYFSLFLSHYSSVSSQSSHYPIHLFNISTAHLPSKASCTIPITFLLFWGVIMFLGTIISWSASALAVMDWGTCKFISSPTYQNIIF